MRGGKADAGEVYLSKYTAAERPASCDDDALDQLDRSVMIQDLDADGRDDCDMVFKRNFAMGFEEDQGLGSIRFAVANSHLVPYGHLADGLHNSKKQEWTTGATPSSERIATRLQTSYGDEVDYFVIAGDMNINRCQKAQFERTQGSTCGDPASGGGTKSWWTALTDGFGYSDTVYSAHPTDEGMNFQYRDGCNSFESNTCDPHFRDGRIDFIFTKRAISLSALPKAASMDLTCGARTDLSGGADPHCDDTENPDRYSDHRLVWSYLGL